MYNGENNFVFIIKMFPITILKDITKKLGLFRFIKDIYDEIVNIFNKGARRKFYSRFVTKGNLCFDVGANEGNRTDIFLSLGAKVICIEPQRICIERLQKKYKNQKRVIIIGKALGGKEGTGFLYLNQADTLSSMSKEWIDEVGRSGRFTGYLWEGEQKVAITTLDNLINTYGNPNFCKIDVEGFEYQVLLGLSKPINSLSFEFALENLRATISCIKYLNKVGDYVFNYSLGEKMSLALEEWESSDTIEKKLKRIGDKTLWGDIYAKLK